MSTGSSEVASANDELLPVAWRDGSRQFRVPPGGTRDANFEIKAEPRSKAEKAKGNSSKKKRGG
jgi:hypothetical protein